VARGDEVPARAERVRGDGGSLRDGAVARGQVDETGAPVGAGLDEASLAALQAMLGGGAGADVDGFAEADGLGSADVFDALSDELAELDSVDGGEVSEPRSIEDLRRMFPELARALENAGAQRREAQLRREAGSREGTRLRVRELLERLGIDERELDDRDERQLDLLYELAAANASEEVMRALATQAAGAYGLTRGQLASIDGAVAEMGGGELSDYAMELFDSAVNAAARDGAAGLTLDDVTPDLAPDLHREIADEVDRQVVAELRARELERRPRRSAPPATPQGRAPGGDGNYDLNDPLQVLRAYRDGFFESESDAQRALSRTFSR
jgi:hypothetical protein